MGEPILNLSAWIDRRRKEVGPYADHIVHSVKAYEARITALEEENADARAVLDRIDAIAKMADAAPLCMGEIQQLITMHRAALEGE